MRRSSYHSAFTLIELLVSIGIALLLVVGVNTVFKVTAQTVGAGNSLLNANRDARTVFQTFFVDMSSVDPVPAAGSTSGDGPFFVIRSEHCFAFRNRDDQQGATSQTDPSTDANLFPNYPGNQIPVVLTHFRSHRVDRMAFFARGQFARQTTSNGTQFVSPTAGNEALIYIGHSQQPSSAALSTGGTWYDPASGTQNSNPNNYYASDWMLSRMAMILIPKPADSNYRADNGGLSPLAGGNPFQQTQAASLSASTDLAATSIAIYGSPARATTGGIEAYSYHLAATNAAGPNLGGAWWPQVIDYRYQASPFILSGTTTPKITPSTLAQCAPDLIRGCSQFIVEYAGNYYTKDLTRADGSASATLNDGSGTTQTNPTPDATGQLDYILVNGVRQIRWYGYPRSTTGTAGTVSAATGDVVPLRDVLAMVNPAWAGTTNNGMNQAPFSTLSGQYADAERFSNNFPKPSGSSPLNYWTALNSSIDRGTRYTYTAAWGPDVKNEAFPKMIRIIIEIDDHDGRLNQPQRYEFIYDVQQ
ncbi:MAG TPA: prepilin-type N-terminal cleavage/methylation domain-containing protein [Tepidisphaeraceae bacterium]|jgi:hypothetical protein|nr:prepilin-type N-terminal cleavage/methylation domain-containing protein [Tepidisphaeraceae bacterium]